MHYNVRSSIFSSKNTLSLREFKIMVTTQSGNIKFHQPLKIQARSKSITQALFKSLYLTSTFI